MGVGIQGKPGGEVPQHSGHCLDVHSILQSQGGEGVPEIVEPDLIQPSKRPHSGSQGQAAGILPPPFSLYCVLVFDMMVLYHNLVVAEACIYSC